MNDLIRYGTAIVNGVGQISIPIDQTQDWESRGLVLADIFLVSHDGKQFCPEHRSPDDPARAIFILRSMQRATE